MKNVQEKNIYWTLFWEFFKIATFVVGGGYAIVPAAEDVFIRKLKWLKEEELLDIMVVAQSVPGLIACNAAIFIGTKTAGILGGLIAALGVVLPSITIITIIAALLTNFPTDSEILHGAFNGIRAAVTGLVAATAWKMRKNVMKDKFSFLLCLAFFILAFFFNVTVMILFLISIPCGIIYALWVNKKMKKEVK